MLITLVVPVYRNAECISSLMLAVEKLHHHFNGELETIFVVDGSPDQSFELLHDALPQQKFRSKLVLLSKNFGSFSAIRVGLQIGTGDYFVSMAADLQEPLELIIDMATELRKNETDIVLGVRSSREDPLLSRIPAQLFWGFYRKFIIPEVPPGGVDTFGCNRIFRDHLLQLDEHRSSLIGQIFWLGFKRKLISYHRKKREHGKSAWTFRRKVNYLLDSVFAFTDLPIRLLIRVGGIGMFFSGLLGLIIIFSKMFSEIEVPGYATTLLTIIFMGALNLFGLGIIGSYSWRTYENTKQRPLAIAVQTLTFEGK